MGRYFLRTTITTLGLSGINSENIANHGQLGELVSNSPLQPDHSGAGQVTGSRHPETVSMQPKTFYFSDNRVG